MKIRRYFAPNMKEGMNRVRRELGPEAVIIQSRWVRGKGLRGFFAPKQLEITAAVEENNSVVESTQENTEKFWALNFEKKIYDEISDLKSTVNKIFVQESTPEEIKKSERQELEKWRTCLEEQEILDELVDEFMEEICENLSGEVKLTDEIISLMLRKKLRKRIKTAPEKAAPIQVFIGPTGVGKTTTLAKLAARYALYQGEKVGIITIDHYRIGAIEQLRTYSDITGLPLEAVMSPKDLQRALERFSGCQRILIDTAGRSTLQMSHIKEIAGYLKDLPPAEIFLVISATTKSKDLKLITENFSTMGYNRLIYTKLDETNTFGALLNGVYLTDNPIIYMTNGQGVPDDISLADVDKVSSLILGEDE